ncbi:hypothetical protein CRYUN_Cryun36dG0110500 [Craigia yunnanensis]
MPLQIPTISTLIIVIMYPKAAAAAAAIHVQSISRAIQCYGEGAGSYGGKMVVGLVGAFNQLTQEINVLSRSSSRLLFKSLKLSIPILRALLLAPDGRPPHCKALSLAFLLAYLQMDAEVFSAGLLIQVLEAGVISIHQVRDHIVTGTAHLLHESLRLKNIPSKDVEVLDDDSLAALRKFCLTMASGLSFWTLLSSLI